MHGQPQALADPESPNTPSWANHLALRADSVAAVHAAQARLATRQPLDGWTARKRALRACGEIRPTMQTIVRSHQDPCYR